MRVVFDAEPSLSPDPEPGWWKLNADFNVKVYEGEDARWITVPAGYRTDLESIPKWLPVTRSYLYGMARRSALVHDLLYTQQAGKEFADSVFLAAMKTEGVPCWARWILFSAVHWFGRCAYDTLDPVDRLPTFEGEAE